MKCLKLAHWRWSKPIPSDRSPNFRRVISRPCVFNGHPPHSIGLRGFSDAPSRREPAVSASQSLPRVAQPSLWRTLIPRFLRERSPTAKVTGKRRKEWNPATFYIVIFMLIGSQAIQMIALRTEFTAFSRRADARISLLKEVIERVQKGEDVDIEGLLGTGDEEKEREWEEVIKEIQEEEALFQARKKRRSRPSSDNETQNDGDATNTEMRERGASGPQQSTQPATNVNKPVQDYF